MNRNIILDYLPLLSQQIIVHEVLLEHHKGAGAMLKVFLKANINGEAVSTIHDYLWGVTENIAQAKCLSEGLLNDKTQTKRRLPCLLLKYI